MYARRKSPRDKSTGPSAPELPRVGQVPQPPVRAQADHAGDLQFSLLDIGRILGDYRWLIFALTLAAGVATLTAASLTPPVYRAQVLLAPVKDLDDDRHSAMSFNELGSIAALAGVKLDHNDRKNEAIATLLSRRFTETFIAAHHLDRVLFAGLWDEAQGRWKDSAGERTPTAADTFHLFDNKIRRVSEDRATGLVTVSIEWQDPQLASQWANALVADVNATLRQRAVASSNEAITYLREQLTRTSVVDLQQVLHRLIESEMKKIILANINEEYAFRVIDPAVAPDEPFKPKVFLLVMLGTFLGLMLGVIAALLLGAIRTGRGSSSGSLPTAQPVD